MASDHALTTAYLRTPRAAAVAGIVFSILLFAVFGLTRLSIPPDPFEPGAWLKDDVTFVTLAMNLVPFAGIAFLWFVGVLRDRLGSREDQFFATVFIGSAFLLLATLFAAAAVVGAIIIAFHEVPEALVHSAAFHFGRGLAYNLINIYLVKTAAVFMITTSTMAVHTRVTPRWLAVGGYLIALMPVWQLLFQLELARISVLGSFGQCFHSMGSATAPGLKAIGVGSQNLKHAFRRIFPSPVEVAYRPLSGLQWCR